MLFNVFQCHPETGAKTYICSLTDSRWIEGTIGRFSSMARAFEARCHWHALCQALGLADDNDPGMTSADYRYVEIHPLSTGNTRAYWYGAGIPRQDPVGLYHMHYVFVEKVQ